MKNALHCCNSLFRNEFINEANNFSKKISVIKSENIFLFIFFDNNKADQFELSSFQF